MRAVDAPRRMHLGRVARSAVCLTVLPGAWVRTLASPASAPRDGAVSGDATGLLRWIRNATSQISFAGTYVVAGGGSLSSSRIVHVCDGRQQFERIEALDGPARQVFRHNDVVHVLWPGSREASVEQRPYLRRFPLQLSRDELPALDRYEVNEVGRDRIAGQEALVLQVRARDALRFSQRWWVDRRNGLLLRADTYNAQGEVIESAAFSEIQFGARMSAQQIQQDMNRLDGYRVRRPVTEPTQLEAEGWALTRTVSGFQPVSTVRRQRPGASRPADGAASAETAASNPATGTPLLQTILSDGMTHVSLFIEPWQPQSRRSDKVMVNGATHALGRRVQDWWITAVGDVPPDTLQQFASALERRKP